MKYEYKTTYGSLYQASSYDSREDYEEPEVPPSDPVEPSGEGWEMVGFAASPKKLYWSWRRPVDGEPEPYVDPKDPW